MRDLYIKDGQGFLLIYSITSASSFVALTELRAQIVETKQSEQVCDFFARLISSFLLSWLEISAT